jgi:hypothetical protein
MCVGSCWAPSRRRWESLLRKESKTGEGSNPKDIFWALIPAVVEVYTKVFGLYELINLSFQLNQLEMSFCHLPQRICSRKQQIPLHLFTEQDLTLPFL